MDASPTQNFPKKKTPSSICSATGPGRGKEMLLPCWASRRHPKNPQSRGLMQTRGELGDLVSLQAPWSSLWQVTPSSPIFCSRSCSHPAMAAIGAVLEPGFALPHTSLKREIKPAPGQGYSPQARVTCSFSSHHIPEDEGSSSLWEINAGMLLPARLGSNSTPVPLGKSPKLKKYGFVWDPLPCSQSFPYSLC